jgi:cytochrome c oxidase assembly protein Cox11
MLGLSYAAVPFYQIFCQTTGFGGTIQRSEELTQTPTFKETSMIAQKNQLLTIQFHADTSPLIP